MKKSIRARLSKIGLLSTPAPVQGSKKSERDQQDMELGLAKLKVHPRDLQRAPQMTQLLNDCVEGGLDDVLSSLRFSNDELIVQFLSEYDKATPRDHEVIPWEAYALKAGIPIGALIGAIMIAVQQRANLQVAMILTSSHADVARKQVRFAKTVGGYKDRRDIHIMRKALPSSKGNTFIMNNGVAAPDGETDDEEGDVRMEFVCPNLTDTQKLIPAKVP